MNKLRDYIKLASFSFAAILIFAALVFLVFWIMINKLNPPFSATLLPAVTSSVGPYSGGLTSTVTKPQIIPSLSVPSQTSPVATSQTSPAATSQTQSWQQGMMVYLARLPSGFNAMYELNLETGAARLLLQPTTNQHFYGPWLSPDSSRVRMSSPVAASRMRKCPLSPQMICFPSGE